MLASDFSAVEQSSVVLLGVPVKFFFLFNSRSPPQPLTGELPKTVAPKVDLAFLAKLVAMTTQHRRSTRMMTLRACHWRTPIEELGESKLLLFDYPHEVNIKKLQ